MKIEIKGGKKDDLFGLKKIYNKLKSSKEENKLLGLLGVLIRDNIAKHTASGLDSRGQMMRLTPEYARYKASKGAPPIANMRGVGKGPRMLAGMTHRVMNHAVRIYFILHGKGKQALSLMLKGFNFMSLDKFTLKGIKRLEEKYLEEILKK